jgi:PKD repeat protein
MKDIKKRIATMILICGLFPNPLLSGIHFTWIFTIRHLSMNLHKPLSILTLGTLILFASSCDKVPETDFTYSPTDNPEAGIAIEFQNTTEDGNSFSWTFGDGGFSSVENPSYIFDAAGTYDVQLTATNDAGEQAKVKSLTITEPTNLSFTIYDSTQVNLLVGAEVWLYDNQADFEQIGEPMLSMLTDAQGTAIFTNMEPMVYYIWALKEAPGGLWVRGGSTTVIVQNETNLFNVPCEWLADETKKSSSQYPVAKKLILRVK